MKHFQVIIYGPRQSNPSSVFYLTRARFKGFGYNYDTLYVDYEGIDEILRESDKFQEMVDECELSKFTILEHEPSEIYEMIVKDDYSSIDEYFYEYANTKALSGLLQPIFETYAQMLNTFITELIEDTQKTNVSIDEEDGCYIVLNLQASNDEINENVIRYCIDRTKSRYSEKFKNPLVYNFIENGIEFFRAEIDFNNIEIEITEIGE